LPNPDDEGLGDQPDMIEKALNKLKFHLMTFGLPDCGNMRSIKKKDLRLRIKCMAAMLKQRQKDLEFRQQVESKVVRL
jgi:hypothetical protein